MVKLSILILNYKTKDLTLRCLKSIVDFYKKELEGGEFEIIVGDNGSFDGSFGILEKYARDYKNIHIIENKENLGFGKGHNRLSEKAKGRYLFFLNSDTQLKDKGLIRMVDYLDKNQGIGILGAKLENPDGSPQASAGSFYNLFNLFLMIFGGERFGLLRSSPNLIKEVAWVSGGSLMIRKNLFEKMGGFDEHFFMYIEDMELCFRAKKLGSLTYFYPEIKIMHKELGSSNRTYAILNIYRGILYFYKKHKSFLEYILVKVMLMKKAALAIFVGILIRNKYLVDTYRKAIKFGI